jgi:hypothetical protein
MFEGRLTKGVLFYVHDPLKDLNFERLSAAQGWRTIEVILKFLLEG